MSFILNIFFPGLGFFRLKQYQLSLIYFSIAVFVIIIYPFSISLLHLLFDLHGLLLFCVFYLTLILYLAPFGFLLNSIKETLPLYFDPAGVAFVNLTLSRP